MARLLLVDDDPDVAEVLAEFLESEGHDVRIAANGEQGLRVLDEILPDVVLLDVEMPVVDGPTMAYRMFMENLGRERVPIVFLSGVADLHRVAARVGTSYYLPKPFTLEALHNLLDKAVRERVAPTYPEREAIERPGMA